MINDEELILVCAVRYACGRQSYMPDIVIGYMTPKIKDLSINVLHIMDRDLTDCRSYSGGMGDDRVDRPGWIRFHDAIREEILLRGEKVENLYSVD